MALSSKQTEYLQSCNHRWNIKIGATGSGKAGWIMPSLFPNVCWHFVGKELR